MDGYKSPFRAATVPSLAIVILQAASIICADSLLFDSSGRMVISALLYIAGTGAAILAVSRKYPRRASAGIDRSQATKSAIVFICFTIAICPLPFFQLAHTQRPGTVPEITEETTLRVVARNEKRYCDELSVAINDAEGKTVARGLVVCEGSSPAGTGDTISVRSKTALLDPALKNISSFNVRQIRRGMSFIIYAEKDRVGIREKCGRGIREQVRESIMRQAGRLFSPDTSSFIKALLLGNQNHVPKKTISDFRRSGVLHVLAASGTHVGILASIPLLLLGLFRVNKKAILAAATAMVWCYLAVTDMPVSLARSCVMFTAYVLQYIFALNRNPLNTLFISATAVLLVWPYELFELGFQLSFGATMGIILLYPLYRKALPGTGTKNHIASSVSLTLAAQAAVMPVILGRIGEINIISILSNIAVVPMVTLLFYVSLFTLSLSSASMTAAAYAGPVCDGAYGVLCFITEKLSGMNGHFSVPRPGWPLILAYSLLLMPLVPVIRRKAAAVIFIAAAHVLFVIVLAPIESIKSMPASFSGGTGRAVLVREDEDLCLAGSISERGTAEEAAATIEKTGYRSLVLYMTSADWKNILNYTRIMKKCSVNEIHVPESVSLNRGFMSLCRVAQRDGVKMVLYKQSRKVLKNKSDDGIIARALDQYNISMHQTSGAVRKIILERVYSDNKGDLH